MNADSDKLHDPIGDVIREDVQRELPVKLSDFERLAITDARTAAEEELVALRERYLNVKRRIAVMTVELRTREQRRAVACYERWRDGQIEVVRRDLDPRDPSSVVDRRGATVAEAQRELPSVAEEAPPEKPVRKSRRAATPA